MVNAAGINQMPQLKEHMFASTIAGGAFAIIMAACALWPLSIPPPGQVHIVHVAMPTTATAARQNDEGTDLRLLNVNLQRPLVDAPAEPPAISMGLATSMQSSWKLAGTAVDRARPMALLVSPDGLTRWFAVGDRADDGTVLKSVGNRDAVIIANGQTLQLKLPPKPTDLFAAEAPAQ
jgi:hypothetical protein